MWTQLRTRLQGDYMWIALKSCTVDSRNVTDVVHKVVAVGSRNTDSAQKFIDAYINGDKSVKPYGSYAGVFADKVSCREACRTTFQ